MTYDIIAAGNVAYALKRPSHANRIVINILGRGRRSCGCDEEHENEPDPALRGGR